MPSLSFSGKISSILRFCLCSSLLTIPSFLAGEEEDISLFYPVEESDMLTEGFPELDFKAGYFFFTDSKMRKVYDSGGFEVQLSGSYPIYDCYELYVAVEYIKCCGKSLGTHRSTSLRKIPVNLGLKKNGIICDDLMYYVAVGPRFFHVHQHNDSNFVSRNLSHNGVGCFVEAGVNYLLNRHCLLSVFGEYSYEQTRLHSSRDNVYTRRLDIGGFTFGAGLGYLW